MEKIIFWIIGIMVIINISLISAEDICPYLYDFIVDNYNSKGINYSTDKLIELTEKINNNGSSISTDTIIDSLINYDSKCSEYKELPLNVQLGILKANIPENEEKTLWEKYKYEIIFITLIILGIFAFEYLKK